MAKVAPKLPNTNQKIPLTWLTHLPQGDEKQIQSFKDSLFLSQTALRRLKVLLLQRLESLDTMETKEAAFDNPSWASKQAWIVGRKKELKDTLELLSFISI